MLEESAYALHNTAQHSLGILVWWSGGLLHALSDCGTSECKTQSGDVPVFVLQNCPTALIE